MFLLLRLRGESGWSLKKLRSRQTGLIIIVDLDEKLKKILKNTKCEGVEVNQLFTFFTSIITQNNRDLTWNYSTVVHWVWVRVKTCQAFQTLRCHKVATVFSILFVFSAIKGPANLDYHLCEVRNMWKKYFYHFQGLRAPKCHRTKCSNRVNYRLKWPLQKASSSSTPPPAWISRVFEPSLPREFLESHLSVGGVDFFWNNPTLQIVANFNFISTPAIMHKCSNF